MNPTIEQLLDWIANGEAPPGSYATPTVQGMLLPMLWGQ